MMKNEKGVTLLSLAVTIVVLFLLVGIGTDMTSTNINDINDSKMSSELNIVRQAITEQYTMAVAVNKVKIPKDNDQEVLWVGERIDNSAVAIELPNQSEIELSDEVTAFYNKATEYNLEYQEEFYYRLTPEKLTELGVKDAVHTYVVNYSTGEVYNETKQMASDKKLLYIPSMVYELTEDQVDNTFNDWP